MKRLRLSKLTHDALLRELLSRTTIGPIPETRPDLGECWLWNRGISKRDGYGYVSIGDVNRSVYRVVYVLVNGPLPEGFQVDHLCRVRACIRPTHLDGVTLRVNTLRSENIAAKNARKLFCKNGHELGPNNLSVSDLFIGRRTCLICARKRQKDFYQKRRSKNAKHPLG